MPITPQERAERVRQAKLKYPELAEGIEDVSAVKAMTPFFKKAAQDSKTLKALKPKNMTSLLGMRG